MIFLSKLASADIKEAYDFLLLENPKMAEQLLDSIEFAFSLIEKFPNIGHERLDLTLHKVRFYRVCKFLIIYRIGASSKIEVVRFLHGYQDIANII